MIVGHQRQWQFLKKSFEEGRVSHGYLFSGQSKLGKKKIALEFIKFLFCQGQERPCQVCLACQALEKGVHPDLFLVEPSKKEIQISQIRELNWRISLYPSLAQFKAAIINEAHCLNLEAQNCFLKTLEEPKGKAILILVTEYPEALFPTILSRIQKISFFPVAKSEIKGFLLAQGLSDEKAEKIAQLSIGKPGLAIEFLKDPQKLKNQDQKIKEIIKISKEDLFFRFQYVRDLILKKENLKEILEIWLRYFREILLEKIGGSSVSSQYSLNKLKRILSVIERINFLINTTSVNQKLAIEQIMLEL